MKYIIRGMAFTLGILIILWLISKIGILGIGGTVKSGFSSIGELFNSVGDFLVKIGGGK